MWSKDWDVTFGIWSQSHKQAGQKITNRLQVACSALTRFHGMVPLWGKWNQGLKQQKKNKGGKSSYRPRAGLVVWYVLQQLRIIWLRLACVACCLDNSGYVSSDSFPASSLYMLTDGDQALPPHTHTHTVTTVAMETSQTTASDMLWWLKYREKCRREVNNFSSCLNKIQSCPV